MDLEGPCGRRGNESRKGGDAWSAGALRGPLGPPYGNEGPSWHREETVCEQGSV